MKQPSGLPLSPHEFDEVAGYIFKNYEHLLTPEEQAAYRTIVEGRPCSQSLEVKDLLAEGEAVFYGTVKDRVLEACPDQVILNRCPKCSTLCRTPTACLCPNPDCNHTWFEERKDTEQ